MLSDEFIVELLSWSRGYQVEDILKICSSKISQNREILQNLKN